MKLGLSQNDKDLSPRQSLDGSFRKYHSVVSASSASGASASSKYHSASMSAVKGLKEYGRKLRKLVDLECFTQNIEDWVREKSFPDSANGKLCFDSPFTSDEMRKLDLALEGVLFQQLVRMPGFAGTSSDVKEHQFLALEDFLNAIVIGLWRTFWHKSGPLPLFVSGPRHPGSRFYSVEKAISRGRLQELHGLALISNTGSDIHVQWDRVVEFALYKPDILSENGFGVSFRTTCEALFYGFHVLVSRSLSKISAVSNDSVFILVLDSKYGGVVKLSGDLGKFDSKSYNPYQNVAEWFRNYAEVAVTPVNQIWNRLGNANWGDLGTLHVLLATFYSIAQWNGPPRKSIASLLSDHSLRLQKRRMECHLENQYALVPFQGAVNYQTGEIVELDQENLPFIRKQGSRLKLKQGDIVLLDDHHQGKRNFQIQESLVGGNYFVYSAVSLDRPSELLSLYVGSHPSRLEPSWEDMSLWYQVQRQTKVLNIFRNQGISCKYLPEIIASGRVLHSGPCDKESPGGRCDHLWCGTPLLVTSPVGEPLSSVVHDAPLTAEEAIQCCRDCLAALRSAAMANVQHGDICPENIICVVDMQGARDRSIYVPISWGRAVLEDRDSPAINLQFSSSHALQHGKLCPSSDAESIIYLLFFVCRGTMPQLDSIESALQWRETSWGKRLIQQQLGQVSALLKAFADYVDSLCGTPYQMDYDVWLKRLDKAVEGTADRGRIIEEGALRLRLENAAEPWGTSGGSTPL